MPAEQFPRTASLTAVNALPYQHRFRWRFSAPDLTGHRSVELQIRDQSESWTLVRPRIVDLSKPIELTSHYGARLPLVGGQGDEYAPIYTNTALLYAVTFGMRVQARHTSATGKTVETVYNVSVAEDV